MKNDDDGKELIVEIGGRLDRLKILKTIMSKVGLILDGILREDEEFMREKRKSEEEHGAIKKEVQETKESIDRGPRIVRPNHKLKL